MWKFSAGASGLGPRAPRDSALFSTSTFWIRISYVENILSTEWSQYVRLEMLEDVTLKEFYSNANLYVELKGDLRSNLTICLRTSNQSQINWFWTSPMPFPLPFLFTSRHFCFCYDPYRIFFQLNVPIDDHDNSGSPSPRVSFTFSTLRERPGVRSQQMLLSTIACTKYQLKYTEIETVSTTRTNPIPCRSLPGQQAMTRLITTIIWRSGYKADCCFIISSRKISQGTARTTSTMGAIQARFFPQMELWFALQWRRVNRREETPELTACSRHTCTFHDPPESSPPGWTQVN